MFGFPDAFEPGGNRRRIWRGGTKDTETVEAPTRREGRGFKSLRPRADWRAHKNGRVTWRDHFVCSRDIGLHGKTVVIPAGRRDVAHQDAVDVDWGNKPK